MHWNMTEGIVNHHHYQVLHLNKACGQKPITVLLKVCVGVCLCCVGTHHPNVDSSPSKMLFQLTVVG